MRLRTFPFLLLAAALLPLPLIAQSKSRSHDAFPGTPEMVARNFFAFIANEQWNEAAALIAPAAREEYRAHMVLMLRALARRDSAPQAEDYPNAMPEAVRKWFEAQRKEAEARSGPWPERVFGVGSAAELDSLTSQELMARALRANDPRTMMQNQAAHARVTLPPGAATDSAPQQVSSVLRTEYHVVGSVPENDSTVLVVYHSAIHQGDCCTSVPPETEVLAVRRTAAGWRVWPTRGLPQTTAISFGISEYASAAEREEKAKQTVVQWPESGEAEGRAHLTGFGEQGAGPDALVVEARAVDGSWKEVKIPRTVFPQIFKLLMPWGAER